MRLASALAASPTSPPARVARRSSSWRASCSCCKGMGILNSMADSSNWSMDGRNRLEEGLVEVAGVGVDGVRYLRESLPRILHGRLSIHGLRARHDFCQDDVRAIRLPFAAVVQPERPRLGGMCGIGRDLSST